MWCSIVRGLFEEIVEVPPGPLLPCVDLDFHHRASRDEVGTSGDNTTNSRSATLNFESLLTLFGEVGLSGFPLFLCSSREGGGHSFRYSMLSSIGDQSLAHAVVSACG